MNDIENNYKALEMPNILFEETKANMGPIIDKDIQTHPFMLPLVKRIARARPQWTIITAMGGVNLISNTYYCSTFKVYEGKTYLGRIFKQYGRLGATVFAVDNDRMNANRKRGGVPSTTDAAKAFKMVMKNFHGKTIDEACEETHKEARYLLTAKFDDAHGTFFKKYNNLQSCLVDYVMKNWDQMHQVIIDAGVSPTALDGMQEAYEAYVSMAGIRTVWSSNKGVTVLIRGNEYIVDSPTGKHIVEGDQLPANIKRSIGILKMVEVNSYVADHGIRVGKDKFFVSSSEQSK
jgi:hypothetical protein